MRVHQSNKKRMKVVATFPVNVGRWLSDGNAVHWAKDREWKALHFMEVIVNPSLFPQPLYGKIQVEIYPVNRNQPAQVRGATQTNRQESDATPIQGSEIRSESSRWQLLESKWFPFPYHNEPVMFWLETKNCNVAMFTLLLGVEE